MRTVSIQHARCIHPSDRPLAHGIHNPTGRRCVASRRGVGGLQSEKSEHKEEEARVILPTPTPPTPACPPSTARSKTRALRFSRVLALVSPFFLLVGLGVVP